MKRATNMSHMFYGAYFNNDLSAWNVSSVLKPKYFFSDNVGFEIETKW
ncbi:BspA family leucine-rich repeat surface protein [Succinivibrio dextrinosolvens]